MTVLIVLDTICTNRNTTRGRGLWHGRAKGGWKVEQGRFVGFMFAWLYRKNKCNSPHTSSPISLYSNTVLIIFLLPSPHTHFHALLFDSPVSSSSSSRSCFCSCSYSFCLLVCVCVCVFCDNSIFIIMITLSQTLTQIFFVVTPLFIKISRPIRVSAFKETKTVLAEQNKKKPTQ